MIRYRVPGQAYIRCHCGVTVDRDTVEVARQDRDGLSVIIAAQHRSTHIVQDGEGHLEYHLTSRVGVGYQ